MHIYLTKKVRVNSPFDLSDEYSYEGPIEDVDLLQQKGNYEKLRASLDSFGLKLTYIWFAKFNHESFKPNGEKYNVVRYHFLVKDETSQIYWRKYEARSMGSGQNYLYLNGNRYKLTDWLNMDEEERKDLLEKNNITF